MIREFENKSIKIKDEIVILKEKLKGRKSQIIRKGYYPFSRSSITDIELRGRQLQDIKVLLDKITYILTKFKINMQKCTQLLNLSKSTPSRDFSYPLFQGISNILSALVMMAGGRKTRRVKKLKTNKNNKRSTRRRVKK